MQTNIDKIQFQKPSADVNPSSALAAVRKNQIHTVLDIGVAIRTARKSRKLTQQNFADLAGVGRRFLSELEAGKSTLEIGIVLKVAAAAGIQIILIGNANE